MHHFFVSPEQIDEQFVTIRGNDVNHIKNVLRMKAGEELLVSNGLDRDYFCQIETITDEEIKAKILQEDFEGTELPTELYLFQGLPKADKMELIIQKAVELGVYEIIPVATKRCVVKLEEKKAASKIARWQQIAEAAAKQSKRRIVPQISNVMTFGEAVRSASSMEIKLIPYELADGMERTKALIEGIQPGQDIAVFIGPEGGFEEAEIDKALAAGIEPVTLGKRILRTETAGFTVMAWIMYRLEE